MKRSLLSGLIVMIFVLAETTVMAGGPHFINADASIDNAGGLVVSWKEAGLGDNQLVDYSIGATNATGFYACVTGGGNHPTAKNKEQFSGPVSTSGTFNSGKNGQITASFTAGPPVSTLECPNGQRLLLACVTYSGITLEDSTNGIFADIPVTVAKTFFSLPECP